MTRYIGDFSWKLPGKEKPFTRSTSSVRELLRLDAQDGLTIQQSRDALKLDYDLFGNVSPQKDADAAAILDHYIKNGYGDYLVRDILPPT